MVRSGPDCAKDGVVRWRRIDLAQKIEKEWGVQLAERSSGICFAVSGSVAFRSGRAIPSRILRRRRRIKKLRRSGQAAIPERAKGKPVEIWWQDEARVGQQGTLTYVWAEKGSRPRALRDQRRQSAYLFGAVCPARAVGAALVLPCANARTMNKHLAEISTQVAAGAHAVILLDGAGWHQTGGKLRLPQNISLLKLPPYSRS